ncbi:MAG TPA: hypothetical protein VFB79_18975 [Candidatus Angelobacter sp.]|nr:hypothetical protein [Candidatus Angelobacter sp.]
MIVNKRLTIRNRGMKPWTREHGKDYGKNMELRWYLRGGTFAALDWLCGLLNRQLAISLFKGIKLGFLDG